MVKRSMKKKEQFLQKNAKIGHVNNLEQLEQPNIDLEEAETFHSGEQNKLEDITESIELNCTTYGKPSTKIMTHQNRIIKLHENRFGTLPNIKFFGTMTLW
jgi:hypothetical protein